MGGPSVLLLSCVFVLLHGQVLADDAHLMACSEDRSWSIWDIGQERVTRLFTADMGAVRAVDMAPDQVGEHTCVQQL